MKEKSFFFNKGLKKKTDVEQIVIENAILNSEAGTVTQKKFLDYVEKYNFYSEIKSIINIVILFLALFIIFLFTSIATLYFCGFIPRFKYEYFYLFLVSFISLTLCHCVCIYFYHYITLLEGSPFVIDILNKLCIENLLLYNHKFIQENSLKKINTHTDTISIIESINNQLKINKSYEFEKLDMHKLLKKIVSKYS